jgi:hypothetical protein
MRLILISNKNDLKSASHHPLEFGYQGSIYEDSRLLGYDAM